MVLPQNGPSWQCVSHGFAPEVALLTGKYIYDYDLKANNSQKNRLHQMVEALTGVGAPMVWATLATLNAAIAP